MPQNVQTHLLQASKSHLNVHELAKEADWFLYSTTNITTLPQEILFKIFDLVTDNISYNSFVRSVSKVCHIFNKISKDWKFIKSIYCTKDKFLFPRITSYDKEHFVMLKNQFLQVLKQAEKLENLKYLKIDTWYYGMEELLPILINKCSKLINLEIKCCFDHPDLFLYKNRTEFDLKRKITDEDRYWINALLEHFQYFPEERNYVFPEERKIDRLLRLEVGITQYRALGYWSYERIEDTKCWVFLKNEKTNNDLTSIKLNYKEVDSEGKIIELLSISSDSETEDFDPKAKERNLRRKKKKIYKSKFEKYWTSKILEKRKQKKKEQQEITVN